MMTLEAGIHSVAGILLLLLCTVVSLVSADITSMQSYYAYLRSADSSIFAGSVLTVDTTGKLHTSSVTAGASNYTLGTPMSESTSFRVNTLSETFVTMSILSLINQGVFPFGLNEAIPSAYLPNQISNFRNPSFPAVGITLQMLMLHTSSLVETGFTDYRTTVGAGSTVSSLKTFCQSFFTVLSGTTYVVQSSVFSSSQPGLTSAYAYARTNTALLGCILDTVISSNPSVVSSVNKTVAAYVQESIFNALGMSQSFLLDTSGAYPRSTSPYYTAVFDNAVVQDVSSAGVSDRGDTFLHPAYIADYMYYSSTADLGRFLRSLFLAPTGTSLAYTAVGRQLLTTTLSLTGVSGAVTGAVKQALGLQYFDGTVMCAPAISSGLVTSCPFSSTSTIYGNIGRGPTSLVGWFCTTQVSTVNPTCVVVELSFTNIGASGNAKSYTMILGFAAAAFYSAIGAQTVTVVSSSATTDPIYGLYVFLGVAGAFIFVISASLLAEHVIQPAPIVAVMPPHAPLPLPGAGAGYGYGPGMMVGSNDGGMYSIGAGAGPMGDITPPMQAAYYD